MRTNETILKLIQDKINHLKIMAGCSGYMAIRARHNLQELTKLTDEEKIEAYLEWKKNGSIA
jgi:uncharacterized protein YggL (DUF469 family)